MAKTDLSDMAAGVQEIARATGRTTRWVQMLAKEQGIAKDGRGRYAIADLLRGLVAHYEQVLENGSRSTAAADATQARADEIRQRMAIKDRTLIPLDEALQAMEIVVGTVNSELTGLPARATRDMAIRRKIEDEVNGTKGRIAASLRKGSAAARSGRGLDGADTEDDA